MVLSYQNIEMGSICQERPISFERPFRACAEPKSTLWLNLCQIRTATCMYRQSDIPHEKYQHRSHNLSFGSRTTRALRNDEC